MVSKFTSRNRTALFRTNSFRWASTYLFLVFFVLGGANNAYAQPTFTQCDPSNVILQPGGADLVLDNITIPAFLSVDAVASAGTVTYTASPASLECADIGGGAVTVTITATDDNGSSTCITNVTVTDGGPAATCMSITGVLTGGTLTVTAAEFDGGSTACTMVTPTGISRDGGLMTFTPALTFTCADFDAMNPDIDIELQVTDANLATATCMATLTLQDEAPTAGCMDVTLVLDATGNATLTTADVDDGTSTTGVCMGGMLSLSRTDFTCADLTTAMNPAVEVDLIATNASGQADTCTANITVQDNIAPMVMCAPMGITIQLDTVDAMGNYNLSAADLAALSGGSTDNCSFTTTVSQSVFTCADVGTTINVTVTVTDPAENMNTCMTTVTVEDVTAPVLLGCPMGDIPVTSSVATTGDCFGLPAFTNPTFTEACPAAVPLTVTYMAGMPAPSFALPMDGTATAGAANTTEFPVGQTIVTFTATDASGLSSSCSFTVTVTDDEIPTFAMTSCPADITENVDPNECDQTVSIVPPSAMDNCGNTATTITVEVSNPNVTLNNSAPGGALGDSNGVDFGDFPVGITEITYTLEDAAGNPIADPCVVLVTIVDNIPPTIVCPPDQTLTFGSCNPSATLVPDYIGLSSATDNCPTNNVQQFPAADTDITTILGPNPVDGASFNVRIIIADSDNPPVFCDFMVTLDDQTVPVPNENPLQTLTLDCGTAIIDAPFATDECGNIVYGVPNQGTFAGDNAPMGNPNLVSFPGIAFPVNIPDDDANGITINLPVSGLDPVLSDFSLALDMTHSFVGDLGVNITAPNGGGTVTLFDRIGVPGSTFGCGANDIVASFSDDAGMSADDFENLCVNDMAGNFMPVDPFSAFDGIDPNGTWQINIADNEGGDTGSLNNLTFNISTLGTVPQPTYEFTPGNYTVQWTYTDANNVVVNQLQQINVATDTEAPSITCTNVTLDLDNNGMAVLAADDVGGSITDNCGVDISTLSVNGASSIDFDCSNIGTNSVTVNVSDVNGNPATCVATVTVTDNILPTLVNIPTAAIDVSCEVGADTTGLNVFAMDNCSVPSITYNTNTTQTGNPALCTFYTYTVTNTYSATDDQGNQDNQSFDINVSDSAAPEFNTNLATSEMLSVGQNCEAVAAINLTDSDVTDNCADFTVLDLNYTLKDANGVIIGGGTGNASEALAPGSYTINYTAVDPCGNASAEFTRSYTVVDDSAPFAICNGGPFTVGLPTSGSITIAGQLINIIDNNSFDNCNEITRTVTRLDGSPAVFTCDDVSSTPIDVLLTVTENTINGASNSCTSSLIIQDNIAPQIICQNLEISLDANGQATITPAMVNNGSFDACSDLNLASLSLDRTMFDIDDVGQTIEVTLSGADNSGNSGSCTAMITVIPPPTCFQVGREVGGAGDVISIPVSVSDFVNVASFQFALEISNTDIADFVGTSGVNPAIQTNFLHQLMPTDTFISNIDTMIVMDISGMDSMVFDTTLANSFDQIAVSFVTDNIPANLNDDDIAFFIDVILTGELQTSTFIDEVINSIITPSEIVYEFGNNNANPTLIQTDLCINPDNRGAIGINQLVIAGQIVTEFGLPVNLVEVDLRDLRQPLNIVVTDDQTGPDGTFRLEVSATSDYRIEPSKDIRWDNGIRIEDVAAIQRHAVGNVFLDSPYKKIAADVSNDGLVTGFDATLLNNYLSTALLGPPPSTNTSWRFVDADQVLVNAPNAVVPNFSETITIVDIRTDSLSNNFIGVKIGDVSAEFADPQVLNEDGDTRSEDDLIFTLQDEAVVAGEVYNLTLNAKNFDQLIGYQFILNFDRTALRYLGTETLELDGYAKVGTTLTSQGQLVLTWYNGAPTTKDIEAALFNLSFEALENAGTMQSLLSITEFENFEALAFNELSEARDIKLEFAQTTAIAKDYQLYQNTPNPFRGETIIGFDLVTEAAGTLEVMDVSGKIIKSYADTFQKGYNQITVSASELPAVGVLYYQLKTEEFTATKKMILID